MRTRNHRLSAAALVMLAVSSSASGAHARRGKPAEIMVLPWVAAARVDRHALTTLDALLADVAERSGREVLDRAEVSRRIKEPRSAALSCRGSVACLAKLGRRARVSEVLYTAVEPTGSGMRLLVIVVNVAGGQLKGQRLVDLSVLGVAHDLDATLRPVLVDLLSPAVAGDSDARAGREPALPDPPLAPPAPPDALDLAPLPSAPPPAVVIATPLNALTAPETTAQQPASKPHWLLWGGVGAGALGAMALAGGAVSGLQSSSAYDAAEPRGTSQREAARLQRDGDAAASRANLLFMIGSALVAMGAASVTLDLVSE